MHQKRNAKQDRKFSRSGRPQRVAEEVTGTVSMTREGYGFIIREGFEDDIFVNSRKMRGALHGDKVRVAIMSKKTSTKRVEGEIIEILERSKRPQTGILQITGNQAWVITSGKNMPYDISVSAENLPPDSNGMKVSVVVDEWPRKSPEPVGHIIDILGKPGDNNTEMHAILSEYSLPYKFSPKVDEEAALITAKITQEEILSRRDFRETPTFTIDPADAKDFDDALSLRRLDNGNYETGIHIADVTFYVKPDSLIDKEALERATSVYLVDRTVPMLPEKLSNNLCSLRPNEDKLCYSAVFEINEKAEVLNRWFGRTIINSDRRFSYEEAQAIIEGGEGPLKEEILTLHKLASRLREDRFKQGAISFERPEMKVVVDENGKPVSIGSKVTKESNWLIEEFMLLANREVAKLIGAKNEKEAKTFVYRVHEQPNIEKIVEFKTFVKHFGYNIKSVNTGRELSSELNKLLASAKGKPEESAIEIMALRSMARAKYSTDNFGHYGLAFDFYTHFTSPIRRYPDMMVHRLLHMYLNNAKSQNKSFYEERCKHSSEREQLATEAERASIKYKMVEFMQDKIGEVYPGNISGITEWGMFVELEETKVEGLVALRDIKDDYLVFDQDTYSLFGKQSHRKFVLGQPVKVKVERADLDQKQLDFSLIWEEGINEEDRGYERDSRSSGVYGSAGHTHSSRDTRSSRDTGSSKDNNSSRDSHYSTDTNSSRGSRSGRTGGGNKPGFGNRTDDRNKFGRNTESRNKGYRGGQRGSSGRKGS